MTLGLWSGDCGVHLSTVNSFTCLMNQFEMTEALWHCALYCCKQESENRYTVEMNMAIRPSNWSKTELLLLSYQLKGIKLLSSDLWPRGVFMHRNAAHWIYSLSWIIPRKPHIQSCLAPTTTPHSKSFKSPSLPILILDLNFSRSSLPCLRAYKPQAAADCRFVSTSSWTVPWV